MSWAGETVNFGNVHQPQGRDMMMRLEDYAKSETRKT